MSEADKLYFIRLAIEGAMNGDNSKLEEALEYITSLSDVALYGDIEEVDMPEQIEHLAWENKLMSRHIAKREGVAEKDVMSHIEWEVK